MKGETCENPANLLLNVDGEALELAETYILNKILPAKFRNDLLHIALATIHHVDIPGSWNSNISCGTIKLDNSMQ